MSMRTFVPGCRASRRRCLVALALVVAAPIVTVDWLDSAEAAQITEFPIPTGSSLPQGITAGPDGALWFTERAGNKIGRITTAGVVTNEFTVPTANSSPFGITAGPDGALWFTEYDANKIGRKKPASGYRLFSNSENGYHLTPTSEPFWENPGDMPESFGLNRQHRAVRRASQC
jgi:hypothetical protein